MPPPGIRRHEGEGGLEQVEELRRVLEELGEGPYRAKKAGPRRGPLSKRRCSACLPDDPAGQKTTGHQQRASAKREQRGAARVGKLAARGS